MLIRPVMLADGIGEWTARLVPALFGIITPVCIYLAARKNFGHFASLSAAGIIAISPWHLYWSQMARFYTMTLFFSSLSLLVAYDGIEKNSWKKMLMAGFLMILGVLSHYSALLPIFGLAAYILILPRLHWERPEGLRARNVIWYFAPFGLAMIAALSKIAIIYQKYFGAEQGTTGTSFANPLIGAVYVAVSAIYRIEPAIFLVALFGAATLLKMKDRRGLFLVVFGLSPILIVMAAGAISHAENRYTFTVLPAFALAAGAGIENIYRRLGRTGIIPTAVVILLIALPLLQHDIYYFGPVAKGERWDYKSAAAYIRTHGKPGQVALSPMFLPIRYYLRGSGITADRLSHYPLNTYKKNPEKYWLVIEDSTRGLSANKEAGDWLKEHCQLQAHFSAASPAADYGVSVYTIRSDNE